MSKVVDLLEEDKPIAQQKFVCVSFVSPENVIKSKEQFHFEQFVKTWDMTKSVEKYAKFTAFLAYKYNLDTEQVTNDLTEFCKEESELLNSTSVSDDYKNFLDKNLDTLELEYSKQNNFQTNTRGLKIRGVYPSQEEAEVRAKMLRENDPYFDVYVGPVGVWMPGEPDAYRTGKVEFLQAQLNELMANKKANEDYDAWMKVGFAIRHATNKSEKGLELWLQFSQINKENFIKLKLCIYGTKQKIKQKILSQWDL